MTELSVIIPSRNEMFLSRTVDDIIEHREADTEVIAVLDGKWAEPPLTQHERVNVIYVPKSIGQRAAGNIAVKLAKGKYIMKVDAHCSFDQGFDRKMLEFFKEVGDNVTGVPVMNNLHAFDWKCKECGNRWYQGPTPTFCCSDSKGKVQNPNCKSNRFKRKMVWQPRRGVHSTSYCFDAEPHFQYFGEYQSRPEYQELLGKYGYTESMSLQGSAFMMTKEKYWELIGDETLGNWGHQGIQIACATWLSGGRVLVNHKTWYAHMFRTQGGDFGFPYEQSGREVQRTRDNIKNLFWNKKHPKQIYPVSWLLEKFWPVKGWSDQQLQDLKAKEVV